MLYNLTISGKSWRHISEPLEGGTHPVLLPVWGFRRGKIHFYKFALESWIYLMVLNRWERKGNPSVTLPLERRCWKKLPIFDIWKLFSHKAFFVHNCGPYFYLLLLLKVRTVLTILPRRAGSTLLLVRYQKTTLHPGAKSVVIVVAMIIHLIWMFFCTFTTQMVNPYGQFIFFLDGFAIVELKNFTSSIFLLLFWVCLPGSTRQRWSMWTEALPSGFSPSRHLAGFSQTAKKFFHFVNISTLQFYSVTSYNTFILNIFSTLLFWAPVWKYDLCLKHHTFYEQRTKVAALVRNLYDFRSREKHTF